MCPPPPQAWLSSIQTVSSAGLPSEYWDTPSKYIGYSTLLAVALGTLAVFSQLGNALH